MTDTIDLVAGDYRAAVDRRGAGLRRLSWRGSDLVCGEAPGAYAGRIMAPWPNRIADGRYTFAGRERALPINEPDRRTALHGLVHSEPWLPSEITPVGAVLTCAVEGTPGYPFALELRASYTVDASTGLTVAITARNTGASPAPYGCGAHPYLTVGAGPESTTLRLPGRLRLPLDGRLLPAGAPVPVDGASHDFRHPRPIGATTFDTPFTALRRDTDGHAWTTLSPDDGGHAPPEQSDTVGLWADRAFDWLQVYGPVGPVDGTGPSCLAVEPMTCPPNAFATGDGLRVLAPGRAFAARFGIRRLDPGPAGGWLIPESHRH